MKKVLALLAVIAFVFHSCKSDFNLTAKWKEQMVIFCLLNQTDTMQYIRINKTFLGKGNAYQMAAVHDSMNYKNLLNVKLEQWTIGGGTLMGSYYIDTTSSLHQDTGIFANQTQVLYRVHTGSLLFPGYLNKLSDQYEYHLTVTNPLTGYTATGRTTLVLSNGSSLPSGATGMVINSGVPITWSFYVTSTLPYTLKCMTGANARLYNTVLRFHYTEYGTAGNFAKYADLNFGTFRTQTLDGGETMNTPIPWSTVTHFLASAMPDDPTVSKRVMGKCELMVYAAGDEFNTYMEVNQPVSSITGDKPTYTNISNGIGLFSARYTFDDQTHWSKPLSPATLNNLATDPNTCPRHIGDANGIPAASCP